jgi:hypothetical protein
MFGRTRESSAAAVNFPTCSFVWACFDRVLERGKTLMARNINETLMYLFFPERFIQQLPRIT